jgi:hypothetical protein
LTIRLTGSKSRLVYLPPLKEGDMTRRQPDNRKMKVILNKKLISVEEGIVKMMKDSMSLRSIS